MDRLPPAFQKSLNDFDCCFSAVPPFTIRILPLANPSPTIGDNLTVDCVVHPSGLYRNPIWRGPGGRSINTMAQGKVVKNVMGSVKMSHKGGTSNLLGFILG